MNTKGDIVVVRCGVERREKRIVVDRASWEAELDRRSFGLGFFWLEIGGLGAQK